MSNQFPTQPQYAPYTPAPVPPKPSKLKRFGLPLGLLLLGLVIGGASGASAVPEPVEIVKEVPGPERIVTKTVKETPASCLKALQHAEEIFQVAADTTDVFSEAITAVSQFNTPGINAATAKISELNGKLDGYGVEYRTARDSCQASR